MLELEALFLQVKDELIIQRLQPNRPMRRHFRDMIRGLENICIAEDDQGSRGRTVDQIDRCIEDRYTSAFGSD